MINKEVKYCYNDLTIVPETITDINSRSQCDPFEKDKLPLFASPMSTITNSNNIDIWKANKITPIVPRNIDYDKRVTYCKQSEWVAFSLNEFKELFVDKVKECDGIGQMPWSNKTFRVCVDLANGHMKSLYEAINEAKELSRKYDYKLVVMTGNIANPETYKWICGNAEVDYIRLSIGSGANCITSTQTSIHYPIASLIDECYAIKKQIKKTNQYAKDNYGVTSDYYYFSGVITKEFKSRPYLVADGGIRGYADVIKALGLGADYVMIGSLFTGLLESAAPLDIECYNSHYKYSFKEDGTVNNGISDILYIWGDADEVYKREFIRDMKSITKESYGMSTKKAQKLINPNAKTKTSEGCTKYITVKETVHQWTENMIAYLKSAMSYTNKKALEEFRGHVQFVVNSPYTIASVNK